MNLLRTILFTLTITLQTVLIVMQRYEIHNQINHHVSDVTSMKASFDSCIDSVHKLEGATTSCTNQLDICSNHLRESTEQLETNTAVMKIAMSVLKKP